MRIVRTVISGSFHRDLGGLKILYEELNLANCQILSPFSVNFENLKNEFVINEKERTLSPYELERRHLAAIANADFVWLHCPNGYIGRSTALEMGFAYSKDIPIFSKTAPEEDLFKNFITKYDSVFEALNKEGIV